MIRFRRMIAIAGLLLAVCVVGLAVFFAGAKAAANMAESLCVADLDAHPGYGGYEMSGTSWPPSFECTIRGNDLPPIVVDHPAYAVGWLAVGTLVVACYAVGIALAARLILRRTPVSAKPNYDAS